ncbi:ExbD/TolR family protein [Penaeicola halotolerans]|uniref:ExbD/TolR family protein n=1 Tax=Penaeicola halotolerans TaxID=2793196 RepID=UPI001CF87762|nr:biopolymer transporter ExbD [Penaeicola halotolerans]
MGLQSKLKVDANFSMSSMTDIIFLLLIFFMLTASFITPSGLKVNLPSSASTSIVMQNVSVTVTKDMQFSVNDKRVAREDIKKELEVALQGNPGSVILHIDKDVPSEYLIEVAGIAASLEANVTVAAKPK